KKGIVTLINQKGCEILNYDEKDIIGKNWFDNFLPKEDGKKVKSIFKKIMSGELLSVEYFENPILTKEGKIRQIAWHNTVLKSENGKIVGTLSSGGDVTERKKAEMALAESEQKFRKFFEYEPEYCYMVSPDGAILEINSAALNTLGYTREELIGKPIRDIYDPESQERMHKLFTQWKKAIEIRNEEMVIVTKNGDRRTVLLSASYVLDEDEKPRHSISIQRDITDRKLAQKALAKSESQYHSLIENIPGVVWTSDENGNTEFISSNVEKIYGFTSSEIYESSDQLWFGRIHPDDVNKVKKAYKHLFTKGESLNIEYRIKNKDGEWVWLQDRSIGAYEKKGVKYADGVFFDVTERKQAEEAMQKSSIIINSTTDAVICTDIAGNITLWNKGAEIIYGYRKEEILGKPISIIYKDEDMQVLDSMIAELMEGKNIPTIEVTCIGKNKKNIEILLSLTTITDNDGNIIELVGITKDITDRKQAEKKIHEHEEQLKSLTSELSLAEERERRRIAAGIHDDIAQRLALAKLELQTVQSTISDSNIISSLRNQCRTIDRIMEDARSLTFELSNHLLYEIGVEAAIESFLNEQIRKKSGIKCLFASEGPKIDLNEDIRIVLYQGVRELLTNTVKHAGASRVEVRIVKTDKQISVIVEDNGVGFDPVESDSTERDRGGFGLFNIRERLEFLGGNLSIHSESGKGTCITMSIPVKLQAIV
ncbi:MAG: PAS domain S-box protein, partial [Sedimentisphaerales bacterium]|nr:PAS domain S-box protein [Sedimentisphaerales bacterium]